MIEPINMPRLLIGLFLFFLGFFVYLKKPKSSLHRVFLFFALTSAIWLITYCFAYRLPIGVAQLLFKIGFSAAMAVPVCAFHFTSCYIGIRKELKFIYIYYAVLSLFVFLTWVTGWVIQTAPWSYWWGYYPRAGFLHPIYIFFLVFIAAHFNLLLFRHYLKAKNTNNVSEENKAKFVFLGICLYCLAPIDYLQNYGIAIFPFGFLFAGIYGTMMAYAILKFNLMDIEVIIRRTAVFASLFTCIFGVISISVVLSQQIFQNLLGWNQWTTLIPAVLIIMVIHDPLKNFLATVTQKYLFQKKYDLSKVLREFGRSLLTELEMDKIVSNTREVINSTINPEAFSIYLWDLGKALYLPYGEDTNGSSFSMESELVKTLHSTRDMISLEDSTSNNHKKNHLDLTLIKNEIHSNQMVLVLPLIHQEKLLGFMLLGRKKSDEEYSNLDLEMLTNLSIEETIAIQNSKSNEALAQATALETLALLADTLSHQFNNRFGTVQAVLETPKLIVPDMIKETENLPPEERIQALLKIINFLYEAVAEGWENAYIGGLIAKTMLLFARPDKVAHDMIDFTVGIQMAYMMADKSKRDYTIIDQKQDIGPDIPKIWSNVAVAEQIFENCFNNSYDAIMKRKETVPGLKGEIMAVFRSQKATNTIRIEVRDNGFGMTEDQLRRLNAGTPNFTTKGSSGQDKGFGAGTKFLRLLIMKNMGGTIRYESKEGQGTTCIIELPVRGKPEEQKKGDVS